MFAGAYEALLDTQLEELPVNAKFKSVPLFDPETELVAVETEALLTPGPPWSSKKAETKPVSEPVKVLFMVEAMSVALRAIFQYRRSYSLPENGEPYETPTLLVREPTSTAEVPDAIFPLHATEARSTPSIMILTRLPL